MKIQGSQSGSFALGAAAVPALLWLPDETFFSLCSRVHVVVGLAAPEQTSHLLFGHQRCGVHDLPGHLDSWNARRGAQARISPEEIAFTRTVLGFYRPFLTPEAAASAVRTLRAGGMGSLKAQLGMLAGGFGADHPLKACPRCIEEDLIRHQTTYWHQAHQWPGVWQCPTHAEILCVDTSRTAAGTRFAWCLPAHSRLRNAIQVSKSEADRAASFKQFAKITTIVCSLTQLDARVHLEQSVLVRAYRERLQRCGLQKEHGRLNHRQIGEWMSSLWKPLAEVPGFGALTTDPAASARLVARVLASPSHTCHPLRHIAMMSSLFLDWGDFWASYRMAQQVRMSTALPTPHQREPLTRYSQAVRTRLLDLLAAGESPTHAARILHVNVATAIAWAAKAGIATAPRPKQLKESLRRELVDALRHGSNKHVAAQRVGVSVQTVTRILRTEVGLHEQWTVARQNLAREHARTEWLKAIESHPNAGCKTVRDHALAAYAWLYRHDRVWLAEHLPKVRVKTPRRSRVNWEARDTTLAASIAALHNLGDHRPATRWEVYLHLPSLKAQASHLARLPQTRTALQALLGQPDAGKSAS